MEDPAGLVDNGPRVWNAGTCCVSAKQGVALNWMDGIQVRPVHSLSLPLSSANKVKVSPSGKRQHLIKLSICPQLLPECNSDAGRLSPLLHLVHAALRSEKSHQKRGPHEDAENRQHSSLGKAVHLGLHSNPSHSLRFPRVPIISRQEKKMCLMLLTSLPVVHFNYAAASGLGNNAG